MFKIICFFCVLGALASLNGYGDGIEPHARHWRYTPDADGFYADSNGNTVNQVAVGTFTEITNATGGTGITKNYGPSSNPYFSSYNVQGVDVNSQYSKKNMDYAEIYGRSYVPIATAGFDASLYVEGAQGENPTLYYVDGVMYNNAEPQFDGDEVIVQ